MRNDPPPQARKREVENKELGSIVKKGVIGQGFQTVLEAQAERAAAKVADEVDGNAPDKYAADFGEEESFFV
jgi:hypothetical protein